MNRTGADFTLDASLAVSGLRRPKEGKGMDDAMFLLIADTCSIVADLVKALTCV